MKCGQLVHLVTLQHDTGATYDAAGQRVPAWTAITGGDRVYARVRPVTGREYTNAQQQTADLTHEVTLQYSAASAALTAACRILYGTRVLNVLSSLNTEERDYEIVVSCKEVR